MALQGFHHLAIQVRDLERTAAFYREAIGLEELARHRREDGTLRAIWMGVPGGGFIALELCDGPLVEERFRRATPGLLMVALKISPADRPDLLARFARLGLPIEHQTKWTVYVRDPEGQPDRVQPPPGRPGRRHLMP